ncbi:hypothetical protein SAMN04487764_1519 [Gillisia sp. Hel1_33_143]|uniref:hypothetical protein n=1 Tax=Gillisia sp. Hel1_33_143 TaxID=1336796 RepID=UPI00087A42EF|nr:hypothetical protein [Gillisia sp. Hel1_33_143]SDS12883.1 hypothetical protein SAMN04487764_1519 [Gillisia sp. Hel1_33_143]
MSQITPPEIASCSVTQNIPVANHVYKYLLVICGSDYIIANRSTYIGSLVLSIQGRNYDVRCTKKKFTKVFRAEVSETYYSKTGLVITKENAQLFNDQVDKKFREELFRNMLINDHLNEKLFLQSMRRYLDFFNIDEEDIKIETLYRDFKRKKDEILSNFNTVSPSGTKCEVSQFVPQK